MVDTYRTLCNTENAVICMYYYCFIINHDGNGRQMDEDLAPTLQNIIDQKTLRWVFVGGKGGVGKTTTSCSLAVQLAKERRNVLVVSTDPAHNLSDAFSQKFTKTPLLVNGYSNLYCMEVDSSSGSAEWDLAEVAGAEAGLGDLEGGLGSIMKDLVKSVPGIDEAMAFGELMKMVRDLMNNYRTGGDRPCSGSGDEL